MNMHLEMLTSAHRREIDCIEKDRRSLKRRVAVLEHECKDMASEHVSAMGRMEAFINEEYGALHTKLSIVCSDMEALKEKTSRLLVTHNELTDEKLCLKEEVKSLRSANHCLMANIECLNSQLRLKVSDIEALQARIASLQHNALDEWVDADTRKEDDI